MGPKVMGDREVVNISGGLGGVGGYSQVEAEFG